MNTFIYDGSFEGLLTIVFEAFRTKTFPDQIVKRGEVQLSIVGQNIEVEADQVKAERVLEGVRKKATHLSIERIYKAYLSELTDIEIPIFNYIKLIVTSTENQEENFANPNVLRLSQITKQINREVHRMHAFVRFEKNAEGVYVSTIEPDFNVMPLIGDHFQKRYADQQWIIFDLKRNYGIFYDLREVQEVALGPYSDNSTSNEMKNLMLEEKEMIYQSLWKKYFDSVNIKERKNMKLHLQHVPKRYWKYLTEKK